MPRALRNRGPIGVTLMSTLCRAAAPLDLMNGSIRQRSLPGGTRPPLLGRDTGELARPVPVDPEQDRTKHDAVVTVELVADGADQVLADPGWVPVAPGRDRGAGPRQLPGSILAVPHDGLRLSVACACLADTGSQALTGRSLEVLSCGHPQGGPQVHTRRDGHTRMAEFAAEVRRLMAERGMSLRGLAKAASYDPSYLSKVLSGHKLSSPYLAARLDDALGAGGTIRTPPSSHRHAGRAEPARRGVCHRARSRRSKSR